MRVFESKSGPITTACTKRVPPTTAPNPHVNCPTSCKECAGSLMVLRVTAQRCSSRPRRFIGLSSRSSISATAVSSQCQQPLRRNNAGPTLISRHLRWSSFYCHLRPKPPSRPPPRRPPSRCVVDGSTTEKSASTWSSGGIDIASDRKHPSHKQERHHSTCFGNRAPGTQQSSLPQLRRTCGRSNRSSASSIRNNSSNNSRGRSDSESFSKSGSSNESSALLKMLGPRWSPYGRLARIDKPAGTLLLLFPCWWSIALAAPMHTLPDLKLLALFATGAAVMR